MIGDVLSVMCDVECGGVVCVLWNADVGCGRKLCL